MPDLLTPPVISKLPLGLLGLFQIKNGGQYPQHLVPTIQPTMEMLGILAANHSFESVTTGTINAIGVATPNVTVPTNEVWFVQYVSTYLVTGAGETFTGALTISLPAENSVPLAFFPIAGGNISLVASETKSQLARDFWLQPTSGIFIQTFQVTGIVDFNINLSVLKFPI